MTTKVTHLYDDYAQAHNAVRDLEAAGFSSADVSIVSGIHDNREGIDDASGAVAGASAGAATGGLLGALMDCGVSEEDAHVYSEGVRRGGTLVTVRAPDILNQHHPVDIPARRRSYNEEGWRAYDPDAPGYTRDQVRAERDRYRR